MIRHLLLVACAGIWLTSCGDGPASEARRFLDIYNPLYQKLSTVSAEANWTASTDVTDQHTGERRPPPAARSIATPPPKPTSATTLPSITTMRWLSC